MIKKALYLSLAGLPVLFPTMQQPRVIPLYESVIPNSKPVPDKEYAENINGSTLIIHKVSRPTLSIFLPPKEKATGTAVIICPGGGYSVLAFGYEGTEVAERFNQSGIAAFVLKYRIPEDSTMVNKEIGPLQDAQRAIQIVRSHAAEWGVNPGRLASWDFLQGVTWHLQRVPISKKIILTIRIISACDPILWFSFIR